MDFSTRVHEFPTTYRNTWPSQTSQSEATFEPLQEGNLTVSPILTSGEFVFGAEVSGVDWSKPIPEDIVHQVSNIAILE
jgi:alpha-ketoglutarate-dependent 2,4-dichlorophenoxyacetate dioxygenase